MIEGRKAIDRAIDAAERFHRLRAAGRANPQDLVDAATAVADAERSVKDPGSAFVLACIAAALLETIEKGGGR